MALYVITDGHGDGESIVVDGIEAVKDQLKEWFNDGTYCFDGDEPKVYKIGKAMSVSVETEIKVKGEQA